MKFLGNCPKGFDVKDQVELKDLYPTKRQDNKSRHINAFLAADIIDRWCFLKENIMMPWDDSEDWDCRPHLEPRLKFYYDMKHNKIDRYLSTHLRNLLHRSKIHDEHLKYLRSLYEAPYDSDSDNSTGCAALMEHFTAIRQWCIIRSEFEFFVYPTVKQIAAGLEDDVKNLELDKQIIAVSKDSGFVNDVKNKIPGDLGVQLVETLDGALAKCRGNDEIHLSVGQQSSKNHNFLRNLSIFGDKVITNISQTTEASQDLSQYSTITHSDDDDNNNCLLAIAGNTDLENLVVSCEMVLIGILIASGTVTLRNCIIQTPGTSTGLLVLGGTVVTLENCLIQNFNCGIVVEKGAKLVLKNCQIKKCMNGIHVLGESEITLENSSIADCGENAIVQYKKTAVGSKEKYMITKNLLAEPEKLIGVTLVGNCEFERNMDGDLCTVIIENIVAEGRLCEASPFFE
jgi:hypothetical protein